MMNSGPLRTPYQGLFQIWRYNLPLYLKTLAGALITLLISRYMPPIVGTLCVCGASMALFWVCSSLAVSHYIYDRSDLYRLPWLQKCFLRKPNRWLSLHAGVNDTSQMISFLLPQAKGAVIDLYNPEKLKEPSIRRARHIAAVTSRCAGREAWPAPDNSYDLVFLIFTAHEFRQQGDRVQLFREVERVLSPGGTLILVEHLRDWANFLAFGPGFLHFFSNRTWTGTIAAAGLKMRVHNTITRFVHVFVLERS